MIPKSQDLEGLTKMTLKTLTKKEYTNDIEYEKSFSSEKSLEILDEDKRKFYLGNSSQFVLLSKTTTQEHNNESNKEKELSEESNETLNKNHRNSFDRSSKIRSFINRSIASESIYSPEIKETNNESIRKNPKNTMAKEQKFNEIMNPKHQEYMLDNPAFEKIRIFKKYFPWGNCDLIVKKVNKSKEAKIKKKGFSKKKETVMRSKFKRQTIIMNFKTKVVKAFDKLKSQLSMSLKKQTSLSLNKIS